MMDFNNVDFQSAFNLIPNNEIAKARLVLRGAPVNSCITLGRNEGTAYLNCEFVILEGKYAKRKVFDKIGIEGNEKWVNAGKARIKAILESANGISPRDTSEKAVKARQIESYLDLNGLDIVIKIGIEHDSTGIYQDRNRVAAIITPDHAQYEQYMNGADNIPW